MLENHLSICIDDFIKGQELYIPNHTLEPLADEELYVWGNKIWQPRQVLRISFLDGSPDVHQRIEEHAREWLNYANLKFKFGYMLDSSEIRITFKGYGYSSLVGTDANFRKGAATMTLGGFDSDTDEIEMRRVVLHEFGHAIGCIHEHSSPNANIPWDVEKVYSYYQQYHGWSRAMVDHNVLKRYSPDETLGRDFDSKSIMQYPVSKELTIGGFEIPWNTTLSEQDKQLIGLIYPFE